MPADTVLPYYFFYRWRHARSRLHGTCIGRCRCHAKTNTVKRNGEEAFAVSQMCVYFDAIHQKQFRQFIGDLRLLWLVHRSIALRHLLDSSLRTHTHSSQSLMDVWVIDARNACIALCARVCCVFTSNACTLSYLVLSFCKQKAAYGIACAHQPKTFSDERWLCDVLWRLNQNVWTAATTNTRNNIFVICRSCPEPVPFAVGPWNGSHDCIAFNGNQKVSSLTFSVIGRRTIVTLWRRTHSSWHLHVRRSRWGTSWTYPEYADPSHWGEHVKNSCSPQEYQIQIPWKPRLVSTVFRVDRSAQMQVISFHALV